MRARLGFIVIVPRRGGAIGRNLIDRIPVVENLNRSAAGLLPVVQLERLAFHREIHGFTGRVRRYTDSTEPVNAIPEMADHAFGLPAARSSAAQIETAITAIRASRE